MFGGKLKNNPYIQKAIFWLGIVGPGLITANIDNDAGGIAIYSWAGSVTGFRLLWTMIPITIALILVQQMSARLGVVSGKGLADLIREKFGLKVTFYTFIFLIFADFGNTMAEFAGLAAAGEVLGVSKYITIPICSIFAWLLITKGDYKIVERVFIIGCFVYLSYIVCCLFVAPPWLTVLESMLIPRPDKISAKDFPIIVGLIGTTITPWMQFYIQSAVVEKGIGTENLFHSKVDVIVGCISMLLVSASILICCASTLHPAGIIIHEAKDAAYALAPLAGDYSGILFGLGLFNASLFAAGLLPLAASYYVCEGLGWESGVDKSFKEAPQFFTIFTFLIVVSAILILIPNIKLFNILVWSQVVNGILIPIVLLYIINLANDPDIMGEYVNTPLYNLFCYLIVVIMTAANGCLIYYQFFKDASY